MFHKSTENTCQQIKTNFLMHTQLEMKKIIFIGQILIHFMLNPTAWGGN